MRVFVPVGLTALVLVVIVALIASASFKGQKGQSALMASGTADPQSGSQASQSPAPPTTSLATTAGEDSLVPPVSRTSPSGATVEVSGLVYGPDCLRVDMSASGIPAPTADLLELPSRSPFSNLDFFYPGSSTPLDLKECGGGRGGGIGGDGT